MDDPKGSLLALGAVSAYLVLTLATWFSAAAVLPQLRLEWGLSGPLAAWLTISVQIGFVLGAVASAALGLSDRIAPNRLMTMAAMGAAAGNAVLLLADGAGIAIAGRIATGLCLAGVYPPALKLLSTWFRRGRGVALGTAIGALTLGSALPHLIDASLEIAWRNVVLATTIFALAGGLMAGACLRSGPFPFPRTPFDMSHLRAILANRAFRLATCGYLGHMWELYAMWAWLLVIVRLRLETDGTGPQAAALLTFAVIAAGAPTCILAGYLADRVGRSRVTIAALALSGACAATIGFTFDGPLWLFIVVGLVWGGSIIADSAQFSAMVTEQCDARFVGTALTVQLGTGFALTGLSIWLLPIAADGLGSWRWVPLLLVPGPILGIAAIARMNSLCRKTQPRLVAG